MKNRLGKQNDVRSSFIGIFERFGIKINYHGFPERTVLLKDIRDAKNNIICDHLWFNYTKQFQALGEIKQGNIIRFDARAKEYGKGYVNHGKFIDERTLDYRLSHPTKVSMIT